MKNRGPLFRAACALAAALTAHAQQTPSDVWQAHADALLETPGLLRFYSLKDAATVQPDRAGSAAALTYRPNKDDALVTEPGRIAGHTAVVLDGACFEAPALPLPSNAFTVALWVRPIGEGTKTGNNGSVNGMIACNGSGYNDGWRFAVYDWKTRQPTFDLGQTQGAFSVRAKDSLSAGFWNHLAAAWDGAVIRLYVNGRPSGEKAFAGAVVPPKAPLKLGFAGFGVGSLKMAVDELAVFDRALPAEQLADLALGGATFPDALKPLVREMTNTATCIVLFDSPALPSHLRGQVIERLVQASRNGAELPSRILAQLPEFLELDAEEQRLFALALADAYARENNVDAASAVFDRLLAFTAASPQPPDAKAADIRQRYAQTLTRAGRSDAAREQYAAISSDALLPPHIRAIAALAAAQTWRQENKLAEASDAFRSAAGMADAPAHLRAEAEACAAECANLLAGRPARDPEASRQPLRPLPAPALTYFVAPNGRDDNRGTLEKPFATLERARDAIRAQRINDALPPGGATVYLRGGTYGVTNTFTLTDIDSGNLGAPVVYRAWRDEKPVFDGGFRVRGLKNVRDAAVLARLPPEARGKVRVADLKAQDHPPFDAQKGYGYGIGNTTLRELFEDGQPLQIARWPNAGFVKTGEILDSTNRVLAFSSERMARWPQAADAMANGFWYHLWAVCAVPVALDTAAGTVTLKERPGNYGLKAGNPFYVFNLLEEIDQPGEWYLDRANGLLYVWPTRHPWFSTLVMSRWDKPFIQADNVQEVVFQGLTFEYGQQHGIVLNACVNTVVAGCVVRRLGGSALIAPQCANLKIYGNLLHTLGHTGMRVGGGNRKQLTSGGIVIENNEVHHFGRCSRTYNPAVLLEGCGARVAHNHFHHAPSSAMRVEGNDHLIEFNDVHDVVQESDDQGGIDMWGNPAYRGVVIRHNRWRDIGGGDFPCGQAGIRFDDAISGMLVYGNLFERTSNGHFGGVQIHGGHHNIIDDNVFVGCRIGVSFSPWGQKRWKDYLARDSVKKLLVDDVNTRMPPYTRRYPEMADLGRKADINSLWRNTFIGCGETFYRKPAGTSEWDNRVLSESAGVPAREYSDAGLYDDPLRAKETTD
jgi:tetratricopeptide (TPR) repeat protein